MIKWRTIATKVIPKWGKVAQRGGMLVSEAGETPLQDNSYDCGLFVCMMAEALSAGREFQFTQAHMPQLRRRLALQLIQGRVD